MVARKFLVHHADSNIDVEYDTNDGLEVSLSPNLNFDPVHYYIPSIFLDMFILKVKMDNFFNKFNINGRYNEYIMSTKF